jgi:hypothetical protein
MDYPSWRSRRWTRGWDDRLTLAVLGCIVRVTFHVLRLLVFEATKAGNVGKEYSIGAINQNGCWFYLAMAIALAMDEGKGIGETVEPV